MTDLKQPASRAAGILRRMGGRAGRAGRATGSVVAGKVSALTNREREPKDLNDQDLKAKVESELFRPAEVPKGSISVTAVNGVVELRGEVKHPEDKQKLEDQALKIPEVREVRNLLHLPKVPAPGRADSPGRQRRRS